MHAIALLAALFVRALTLPAHATIDPFGPRSLMAVAPDGKVAATLTVRGYITRLIVWTAGGSVVTNVSGSIAGFESGGSLLINTDRPARVAGTSVSALDLRSCEDFPQSSIGPAIAGALANGSLIATMRSPAVVDLDDINGQNAPVVLHLRSNQCLNMGNGVALGTAGLYTAGYTAYIANVPAPSNVTSSKERFIAMRWHERTREPLGAGVAVAVNASGAAVGADVPPGLGAAYDAAPHALLWQGNTPTVQLAPASPLSVAYAIDDRGRVTGMLEDADHRHYAFLYANGTLHRLDDLARAPGWRFECGYAFTPGGGIAGIGTYRGTATAFIVTGL